MYKKILSVCIILLMLQFTSAYAGVGVPNPNFKDLKAKTFILKNYKSPQDLKCGFSLGNIIFVVGTINGQTYMSINILAGDGSGNFSTYDVPVGSFLGDIICNLFGGS